MGRGQVPWAWGLRPGPGWHPAPPTSPDFPACGASTVLSSGAAVQAPCEQPPKGSRLPQYSSHRRLEGRATASGRHLRWAGGLPVGGSWRIRPSVLAGSHAQDCPVSFWAATPSGLQGHTSPVGGKGRVRPLFCALTKISKLPLPWGLAPTLCSQWVWRRQLCPSVSQQTIQGEACHSNVTQEASGKSWPMEYDIGYK